jgi:hypothetical protein
MVNHLVSGRQGKSTKSSTSTVSQPSVHCKNRQQPLPNRASANKQRSLLLGPASGLPLCGSRSDREGGRAPELDEPQARWTDLL